jgi:drug/metabolite transporter (DMT)-like permease
MLPSFSHNGVLVAIIAHGLIGISLVWDKVLLKRRGTQNLFSYVFWLGAISIFGLILIPFGYRTPRLEVIGISLAAGAADLAASFFYYAALKRGQASDALAVMGGFAPVATAAFSHVLLRQQVEGLQLIGFAIMCTGGFVMFFSEKFRLRKLIPPMSMAAALFGLSNVLEKMAYNKTNFVSAYVWFTIGTFLGSVSLLIPPSWRKQIFTSSGGAEPRSRFGYFINRFVGGVGSFLVVYAISRTYPDLVSAISGVRYAIIFLGALLLTEFRPQWLKEDFQGLQLITKVAGTCLVIAGVALAGISGVRKRGRPGGAPDPEAISITFVDCGGAQRTFDGRLIEPSPGRIHQLDRQRSIKCARTAYSCWQIRGKDLEARVGIEPTHKGFADLSLTTWVPRPCGSNAN